ncbi:hypothetical protein LOZ12_000398 [Ophidiomyces ophidiicola]|uniref:Uncharacterized protein n=1 Tax=Ophidiomyces ophidiicola TaxID=1387563 RepID=A0ACB8UYM1_9EURO|nr:uncharacterized protein LOZ57_002546 [Ophidiomyces ophidiicola]KAI1919564.1 hypothetical protein LOZ64_002262 [Ophidiomyces ophidiicola]KAI1949177.1 hypothetical protein LOZ57_002546 [Ophidiomyces ophidiicola]KAI1955255.1 hypothetical protein LOZ62_000380 [Ophidiomyces ophidiicola]KAI1967406.1 hypothetical protein LOZ59_000775 [Ophidiomyces ophidiicola]KAI1974733.1 hypothetical protein LOZ56_001032 [Ophidiomyces ophidiicola]
MISSSICRMARTPTATLPAVTPRPSAIVLANSASTLSAPRYHQRRYSSSKPPVPPSDGSRGIDAPSHAPTKSVNPSKKDDAEKRPKRRAKEIKSKIEPSLNLPSVPSTQHLNPQDIHVASFFSIYRPMSVTTSVPPSSSPESFASIFSPKKQAKSRHNDVIYTIASAVKVIESAFPKPQNSSEGNDLRAAVTQASTSNSDSEVTHLDGVPAQDLRLSVQEFAKRLRPFNPPPPPVAMDESQQANTMEAEVEAEAAETEQSYSSVLTIRESNHADGSKTYEAYTTPFVRVDEMEAPSAIEAEVMDEKYGPQSARLPSHLSERMRIRRLRLEEYMERKNRSMYAISVKRQRKLKMKKHKYKKLMRKTRTLRRKLEKT